MPPISLRYTPPYKLHLRKGKYYVSVVAPDEIKHFYADGRSRRSTGTNDQGRVRHLQRYPYETTPQVTSGLVTRS